MLLVFVEDLVVIDVDPEDPVAQTHEFRFDAERVPDCSRQTGGSRQVVSNAAVLDLHVHRVLTSPGHSSTHHSASSYHAWLRNRRYLAEPVTEQTVVSQTTHGANLAPELGSIEADR